MKCCPAEGIERQFDRANANKQLRRLRRRGPAKNTRLLIEALGAVYPRHVWWVRGTIASINVVQRLKRSTFRLYLHSPGAIAARLRATGLERVTIRKTFFWEIAVFARAAAS